MDNVFPEELDDEELELEEMDEVSDEEESESEGYKKSVCFDEELGDFKRDGTKKLVECSGVEAWIQWCTKILQTKRYACQVYSDDIGIDIESAFQAETRQGAENILRKEIMEALEADPYGRTEYVESVSFQWFGSDSVEVTCNVMGIDSNEIEFSVSIDR